jgi:hypothetical protein
MRRQKCFILLRKNGPFLAPFDPVLRVFSWAVADQIEPPPMSCGCAAVGKRSAV